MDAAARPLVVIRWFWFLGFARFPQEIQAHYFYFISKNNKLYPYFLFSRSPDGLDTMKLFVIANSIVMLTTIVYPHIQTVYGILVDTFYGDDIFEWGWNIHYFYKTDKTALVLLSYLP